MSLNIALDFYIWERVRLAHKGIFIFAGSSVCDDPGKYLKILIPNCVINRLMSILFSFQ